MSQDELRFKELGALLDELVPEALTRLAYAGEGYAKINMPFVDTGFARNTIQAVAPGKAGTPATREQLRNRDGNIVARSSGQLPQMAADEAGIGIAAEYGIHLENQAHFIANAAGQLKADAPLVVQALARERGLGE